MTLANTGINAISVRCGAYAGAVWKLYLSMCHVCVNAVIAARIWNNAAAYKIHVFAIIMLTKVNIRAKIIIAKFGARRIPCILNVIKPLTMLLNSIASNIIEYVTSIFNHLKIHYCISRIA